MLYSLTSLPRKTTRRLEGQVRRRIQVYNIIYSSNNQLLLFSGCDYLCLFMGPMFCEYLACQNADSAVWIGLVEGTCSWCFALEQFGNPCVAPLMLTFMRTQYRRVFNIPGDTCQDYCCSTYCYCCTSLQMKAVSHSYLIMMSHHSPFSKAHPLHANVLLKMKEEISKEI